MKGFALPAHSLGWLGLVFRITTNPHVTTCGDVPLIYL